MATYASISWFDAFVLDGSVTVEWRTSLEVGTVGFHLLRYDPDSGEYLRLHEDLLPGLLVHPEGGAYRFEDSEAPLWGELTYLLEEVEARGSRRWYGPYTLTVADGPTKLSQKAWMADREELSPVEPRRKRRLGGERFERRPHRPSPERSRTHTTSRSTPSAAATVRVRRSAWTTPPT